MDDKKPDPITSPQDQPRATSHPDDNGAFVIEGFLKISDPNTQEVLVEKRA